MTSNKEILEILLKKKVNIEDIKRFKSTISDTEIEKAQTSLDIPNKESIWIPGWMKEAIEEYENMSEYIREAIEEYVITQGDEMDNLAGYRLEEHYKGSRKKISRIHAGTNKRISFSIKPSLYNQLPEENRPNFVRLAIWNKLQGDFLENAI